MLTSCACQGRSKWIRVGQFHRFKRFDFASRWRACKFVHRIRIAAFPYRFLISLSLSHPYRFLILIAFPYRLLILIAFLSLYYSLILIAFLSL